MNRLRPVALVLLAFCGSVATAQEPGTFPGLPEPLPPPAIDDPGAPASTPAQAFFAAAAELCGKSFGGRVLVDTPPAADDPFAGQPLSIHFADCSDDRLRIPFHVGADRSRTWLLTRTDGGLKLKHEHREPDGTASRVTMYGGDSAAPGSATRQAFPADAESVAMFRKAGLAASVANTWALELEPGRRLVYELSRPDGRLFRAEFDLAKPLPARR
jgi:hypothetical protein